MNKRTTYIETVRAELVEAQESTHISTRCACAVGANAPYSHGLPLAGAMRTDSWIKRAALFTLALGFGVFGVMTAHATTVALSAPASGAVFVTGSNITISASATPSTGQTITKVDFYQGTTLIATDTTSPYSIVWSAVPVGSYSLTAKATTNTAAVTTSAARTITVAAAPTVSLTAPANNAGFVTGSTIALSATAAATGQTISKVNFYRGTTLISSDTTAPYTASWTNAAAGSYSLTAKVTTNLALTATSTAVAVNVAAAPTISLSAPANNTTVGAGSNVTISATATATGQTISKVDFYQGTTLLGTATTAPYSYTWNNIAAGSYSLTAKVTTTLGLTATSPASTLNVAAAPTVTLTAPANNSTATAPASFTLSATTTNVAAQTVSKVDFYNGATLLGTATTAPYTFNWSNVAAGSYSLTAKVTGSLGSIATSTASNVTVNALPTISLIAPANGTTVGAGSNVTLTANAAVAGQTITQVDFYNGATLLGTATTAPYSFTWNNVAAGSYSLTAKVTTNLGLTATSPASTLNVVAAPTISLTSPANNATATAPASFTLSATASAAAGQAITQVDFYQGATLLGTATTAPYSYIWSNAAAGNYSLTAKATDSLGSVTTSTPVTVTVNALPTVSLTSPSPNATMAAPGSFTLTANASSPNSSVSKVEFFADSILINTDTTAPYTYQWNNVATGTHNLIAVVTDAVGNTAISTTVTVTVNAGVVQAFYIHTDHLDTPRVITDTAGNKVWQWDNIDPFGNNVPDENPSGLGTFVYNQRFAGQYFDKETNTHYNVNRDYDPSTGRYIQSDPIGLYGGVNTYIYVNGNPLRYVDPYGLWAWGDPIDHRIVDAAAGYGDAVSMGGTKWIRDQMKTNDAVNMCSDSYAGGKYAGYAWDMFIAGAWNVKKWKQGYEYVLKEDRFGFTKGDRFAPWGNRTGHPNGERPHYHRRGDTGPDGNPLPGQGRGNHRPWEGGW